MIILGIDPGLATIGYGVIQKNKKLLIKAGLVKTERRKKQNPLKCLNYGLVRCGVITTLPSSKTADRLNKIYNEVKKIVEACKPDILAIESLFFFKNLKTALPVSQAKGVILLVAAKKKMPVYEFTPPQVKMIITGYGKAEKIEIQKRVKSILRLKESPKIDDTNDALAVAICGALKI